MSTNMDFPFTLLPSPKLILKMHNECILFHPLHIKPIIIIIIVVSTNHPNANNVTYLLICFNLLLINFIYDVAFATLLLIS